MANANAGENGKKTRFKAGKEQVKIAEMGWKKSAEVREARKSMQEVADEDIDNEKRKFIVSSLYESYAKFRDKKSLELLLKIMGAMNIKIDMDANVHGSLEDALNEL